MCHRNTCDSYSLQEKGEAHHAGCGTPHDIVQPDPQNIHSWWPFVWNRFSLFPGCGTGVERAVDMGLPTENWRNPQPLPPRGCSLRRGSQPCTSPATNTYSKLRREIIASVYSRDIVVIINPHDTEAQCLCQKTGLGNLNRLDGPCGTEINGGEQTIVLTPFQPYNFQPSSGPSGDIIGGGIGARVLRLLVAFAIQYKAVKGLALHRSLVTFPSYVPATIRISSIAVLDRARCC